MIYSDLLVETQTLGIEIVHMNFKGNSKGYYADNTIAMANSLQTSAEKNCILAEELGHHHTTSGNILNQKKDKCNQEKKARNWAYEKLVSFEGIISAYNAGTKNRYELADYLNVTEEFLEAAIIYYKNRYGLFYKIGDYTIYFDPLSVIRKFGE